jgi:response regulator NasT
VILTAFSQRDLVERARDAGAMAYLVKPFTQQDLVPAIEMALSRFAELASSRRRSRTSPRGWRPARPVERAKSLLMAS